MKLTSLYFSIPFTGNTQLTNSNYTHNQLYRKVLFKPDCAPSPLVRSD